MKKIHIRTLGFTLLLVLFGACNICYADLGPTCGSGGSSAYPCSESAGIECYGYFCRVGKDDFGKYNVLGGVGWDRRDTFFITNILNFMIYDRGQTVADYCKQYCRNMEAACDTDECHARFQPVNVECSLIEDEDQRRECEYRCNDTILSSSCGLDCILNGVSDDDAYNGCEWASGVMIDECYAAENNDEDCATLPLKQTNHWSLLSILLTLLVVVTSGLIVVVNRKNEKQNKAE